VTIRCKFKIDSIKRQTSHVVLKDADGKTITDERGHAKYGPGESWSIEMSPVYANNDPEHENSKFWAATPSGRFEVNTVNKDAVATLELGHEYYIDITRVP
jgi:hypothetical protein